MNGQKIPMWIISDLKRAGFVVSIERSEEYPVIVATMGKSKIKIDTDKGSVEGTATEETIAVFKEALCWLFTDFKESEEEGKVYGNLFGVLYC